MMSMLRRSLLATLALSLSSCASSSSSNKSPSSPPPTGEAWSDPATWPSNHVPEAGDKVVIPEGKQILLDVTPPDLAGLTIDGTLVFDDKDLQLTSGWIVVHGELRIGTEERLHNHAATLTLTAPETEDVESMGSRGILVIGGRLELHGQSPKVAWTQLDKHAEANTTSLHLKDEVSWKKDDELVVAPTDFYRIGHTELLPVASASGKSVELAKPLEQFRWGLLQYVNESGVTLEATDSVTTSVVDERAEVGNLTRPIVIQAPEDDLWKNDGFGAHVMVMAGSQARVEGVEFRRVGQAGVLARYPMHWHLMSYTSEGEERTDVPEQYIRNSSIHDSSQRCVVLHGTNDVTVQNNICYDIQGHAIFLEDAVERRNVIEHNLVLGVHRPDAAKRLLIHDDKASGFWLTNPDNVVRGNVAADSEGMGIWLAFPEKALGPSSAVPIEPTHLPFGTFEDNTSHSNGIMGLMFDDVPADDQGNTMGLSYQPHTLGTTGEGSVPAPFMLSGTRLYKHEATWGTESVSFWNRARGPNFHNFVTSDFDGTAFAGASVCEITSSLVVAETLNNANLPLKLDGNLQPFLPGETPVGAASYHSDCTISDNVFVNLPAVAERPSGAFGTSDYYIRGVDKGLYRNPKNRLINSHPGFRATSPNTLPIGGGRENFAFAGALWDPYGYWGPEKNYWVYDLPFFTDGTTCTDPLEPHKNDRSCAGPYYGVNMFTIDDVPEGDWRNPLRVTRQDNDATWFIDDGNCTEFLGNMRHFAALRGKTYAVTFPPGEASGDNRSTHQAGDQITCEAGLSAGTPAPTKVQFRVTGLLEDDDYFLMSVPYSGASTPTVFATISSATETPTWESYAAWEQGNADWKTLFRGDWWHPITAAASADEVIASDGDRFYQDKTNNTILLKMRRMGETFLDDPETPLDDLYKELLYVIRDDI